MKLKIIKVRLVESLKRRLARRRAFKKADSIFETLAFAIKYQTFGEVDFNCEKNLSVARRAEIGMYLLKLKADLRAEHLEIELEKEA